MPSITSPSSSILTKWLPSLDKRNEKEDPNKRRLYDQKKADEHAKLPLWERMLTDVPMGIGDALLGNDPRQTGSINPRNRTIRDNTNLATQALGLAVPAFGITKYLKGGIPDVNARRIGTQAFRDRMKMVTRGDEVPGNQFANRYPRIAAHMNVSEMPTNLQKDYAGLAHTNKPFTTHPSKIDVNISPNRSQAEIAQTIAHEGTHAAQLLGLGEQDFNSLYAAAQNSVGYKANPLEFTANMGGARNKIFNQTGKVPKYNGPAPRALDIFEDTVPLLEPGSDERIAIASTILNRKKR